MFICFNDKAAVEVSWLHIPRWESPAHCTSVLFSCWLAAILLLQESKSSDPRSPYTNITHTNAFTNSRRDSHAGPAEIVLLPPVLIGVYLCAYESIFVCVCVCVRQSVPNETASLLKLALMTDLWVKLWTNRGAPLVWFRLSTTKTSASKPAGHSQVAGSNPRSVWGESGQEKSPSEANVKKALNLYPLQWSCSRAKGQSAVYK